MKKTLIVAGASLTVLIAASALVGAWAAGRLVDELIG